MCTAVFHLYNPTIYVVLHLAFFIKQCILDIVLSTYLPTYLLIYSVHTYINVDRLTHEDQVTDIFQHHISE